MNRSLMNVILGGMGTKSQGTGKARAIEGTATEATAQQVYFDYPESLLLAKAFS